MKTLLMTALFVGTLGSMAHAEAFKQDYVGEVEYYRAKYEDTLVHLAKDNGVGFVEIRAANPDLDPWIPGEGAKVVLPKQHLLPNAPRQGIVINLPEMRLYYFEKPGQKPQSYALGVGREGLNTPVGTTTVVRKKVGPTWTPTERMRKEDPTLKPFYPPGPDNPMGTHALYLGWPTYAIHGTDKPFSIGRRASSGCIRLYPEGIKDFFPRVPVGTKVTVVDQPIKAGWIGDRMYIEVHPTQEQNLRIEDIGSLSSYEITRDDIRMINAKAGPHKDKIDWEKVRAAVKAHSGIPTMVLDPGVTPSKRAAKPVPAATTEAAAEKPVVEQAVVKTAAGEEPVVTKIKQTNFNLND